MSDTNTEKKNKEGRRRARAGGLTLRILSVNVLPLLVLVVGLLSLGKYQENLVGEHLKILQERAQTFAIAIEGPQDAAPFNQIQARTIIQKLAESRRDTRIRLFGQTGDLVADSYDLAKESGGTALSPHKNDFGVSDVLAYLGTNLLKLLPSKTILIPFPETSGNGLRHFTDVQNALQGQSSAAAWRDGTEDRIILTAAAPVIRNGAVTGVVLLVNDGRDIETAMDRVRFDVLTATLAALSLTIFLSLYLAGIIGRPLKKLARAAEKVRQSRDRQVTIPDLSHRRDEIGELSMALRDMTQALWDRMDSIERFAADVAHEIKNPLTSLRSAVETAAKVKNPADRERLMDIILHDVQRLDRLITDISSASRLDAALSRDQIGSVDLVSLLRRLADSRKAPLDRGGKGQAPVNLDIKDGQAFAVRGNEGRLAQVFENLIANALSFSPPGGIVTIRLLPEKGRTRIEIADRGPGIPETKLTKIFERFYTERPDTEAYGLHSGLGLSIARQIIEAHGGHIFAENIVEDGKTAGARFTVILDNYSGEP